MGEDDLGIRETAQKYSHESTSVCPGKMNPQLHEKTHDRLMKILQGTTRMMTR